MRRASGGVDETAGSDVVVPPVAAPEMWHVVEGECYVTDADGATAEVRGGRSVFLPAGWTGRVAAVPRLFGGGRLRERRRRARRGGRARPSSAVYRPGAGDPKRRTR